MKPLHEEPRWEWLRNTLSVVLIGVGLWVGAVLIVVLARMAVVVADVLFGIKVAVP